MPSISSKTSIQTRIALRLDPTASSKFKTKNEIIDFLRRLMKDEYEIIPDKDRVGKGSVYLAKTIGKQSYDWLIHTLPDSTDFWQFVDEMIVMGVSNQDRNLYNLGLVLFGLYMSAECNNLKEGFKRLVFYATNSNWEVREMAGYAIRECVKKKFIDTIPFLWSYVRNEDENLRRIVSESLRPLGDIKWLRNPNSNDIILDLLAALKADSSIYVRKSVGNN